MSHSELRDLVVESWPSPGPCWLCRSRQFELISLLFASAAFGFVADLRFMLFNLQHLLHLGSHGLSCCIARGGSKSHLVAAPGLQLPGHSLARTSPRTRNCSTKLLLEDFLFYFWFFFLQLRVLRIFILCVVSCCFSCNIHFFFRFVLFKYYLFNMIVLNVFFVYLLCIFPKYFVIFFSYVSKIN